MSIQTLRFIQPTLCIFYRKSFLKSKTTVTTFVGQEISKYFLTVEELRFTHKKCKPQRTFSGVPHEGSKISKYRMWTTDGDFQINLKSSLYYCYFN